MQRECRHAAFFDIDNTLLNLKSMFAFQEYFYAHASTQRGAFATYAEFVADLHAAAAPHDRLALNRRFYESFRGRRVDEVSQLAKQWFGAALAQHGDRLWIASALHLAGHLRRRGYLLVAVSGSAHEILRPLLQHLEFDACLATTLESDEGVYTGRIVLPQVIGDGKAAAMRRFADAHGIDLQRCIACGDHLTDLPMLEAADKQFVVRGDPALERVAMARGWQMLETESFVMQPVLVHI